MRFMLMHKLDESRPELFRPTPEFMAAMGRFMQEATEAGVLLTGEGLRPTSEGAARITVSDGKQTVTDGPFTETKELIAGFALIQAASLEEAVKWGRRFAELFDDVEVDVRRVAEMADVAPPA
ncbi:MAG TPA: YciI family protein [Thermomonospora sp.]|nr:YciI family protein [Thermomonospora sp.]